MSTKLYLYKRSNGVYYIGYFQGGIKHWRSTGQQYKAEALKVLSEFEKYLQKELPAISFTAFVEQFKTRQANVLRQSTMERIYQTAFDSFLRVCGKKSLSSYTVKDVEAYKGKRLETCSPVSVNIEFRTLRAAFNLAVKWKLIKQNPFLESSQVKVGEKLPVYLTQEQFRKVLRETNKQVLNDIFLIAVLTGMRLGEIISLEWDAIDLQRRLLTVKNTASFQTKTGRVRVLPMATAVYDMLSRRAASRGIIKLVFHCRGFQLPGDYVSKQFKKVVGAAGLNEALHFHSLRHTAATWLVQSGANIYQVQKLLGHSSVKTSEIYSHLAASELQEVVNKVGLN